MSASAEDILKRLTHGGSRDFNGITVHPVPFHTDGICVTFLADRDGERLELTFLAPEVADDSLSTQHVERVWKIQTSHLLALTKSSTS